MCCACGKGFLPSLDAGGVLRYPAGRGTGLIRSPRPPLGRRGVAGRVSFSGSAFSLLPPRGGRQRKRAAGLLIRKKGRGLTAPGLIVSGAWRSCNACGACAAPPPVQAGAAAATILPTSAKWLKLLSKQVRRPRGGRQPGRSRSQLSATAPPRQRGRGVGGGGALARSNYPHKWAVRPGPDPADTREWSNVAKL